MKNKTKIMLIIITLLLVVGLGSFIYYKKSLDVDNKPVVNNNIDEKDSQDEANNEENENQNTSEEQEKEVVTPVEQEEQKVETPKSSNSTNSNKNSSSSSNNQNKNPVAKEEPKKEEKPVINNPPSAEKTAWEKLGISEYDYYHTPAIKGQKVTHSTRKACIDEGNAKALESDDLQFGCTEVISYSGDTLGYMLIIR